MNTADLIFRPGDEVDQLLDKGMSMPTLIEYLKGKLPQLKGSDNVSGYMPYIKDQYNYYDTEIGRAHV